MFYVSTVLRDGVNEDRHGRESKQTAGHLPRHMGPLPWLVLIFILLLFLLVKGTKNRTQHYTGNVMTLELYAS